MPAKTAHHGVGDNPFYGVASNSYYHAANQGIGNLNLFRDPTDYGTFLGFLQEYLSPINPEKSKTSFTINGRQFQGVPHQPKNYHGKIELIAFSLNPNHFHLVLHQLSEGSLEKFMRSLSTRYSIYYNKRYQHRGSLFEGPYQSVQLHNPDQLQLLTTHLHQGEGYNTLLEYAGERETAWVKPEAATSMLNQLNTSYKDYVTDYQFNQNETELLNEISLEKPDTSPSSKKVDQDQQETVSDKPVVTKTPPRVWESFAITAVFVVLVAIGLRNINATKAQTDSQLSDADSPAVLSETTDQTPAPSPTPLETEFSLTETSENTTPPTATPSPKAKISPTPHPVGVVKISEKEENANIYQAPTFSSEIISPAINGEFFEIISVQNDWTEVKLGNGLTGFIYSNYIEIVNNTS